MPSDSLALDELLAALVAETPDVTVSRAGEYARGGVVFGARSDPAAVELRLGPDIADAALRTPGTRPSSRGEDWVVLQAADWSVGDDRLEAWYRVAWRNAGKAAR